MKLQGRRQHCNLQCAVLCFAAVVHAFDPPAVFPASTRQALVEKSQEINRASYSTAGWSNRAATVLTPQYLDETTGLTIYTADRPFYWNKIDVGCRCTIVELPSSSKSGGRPDLWVHSPVTLDGPLQAALDAIGTVKYVVSPNYEHVSFASQWHQAYGDKIQMWACPGLMERMPEIIWKGEIPFGYRPSGFPERSSDGDEFDNLPDLWDTSLLQPMHIDVEKNPFTGKPFFNEVVYYHKPSRCLITTDLFWNYPANKIPNSQYGRNDEWELAPSGIAEVPFGSRMWKVGMDKVYKPFFDNLMVTNKDAYRDICKHIVDDWQVDLVIPAHGDLLRGREFVRDVLTRHFQL